MYIRMQDRLPGSKAGVGPNIKTANGWVRLQELFPPDAGQVMDSFLFGFGDLKCSHRVIINEL